MEGLAPEFGVAIVPAPRRRGMVRLLCAIGMSLAVIGAAQAADLSPASRNLFDAIQRNDLAAVQISIANGADLSVRNSFGMLPVDLAVEKGHFEIAHYLLSLRQMEGKPGDDAAPEPAEGAVARPAEARPPVQSAPLPAKPLQEQPAETPLPSPSPVPQLGGGAADPFDPMAVPDAARHPVITGSDPANPGDGVAEPPPPPAVPEDIQSQAAPSPRPEPAGPEATAPSSAAKSSPDLLNRLGDMLGLDEKAGSEASAPPPPVPPTAEPEVAETGAAPSNIVDKESASKPTAAAAPTKAPIPPKKPEPPAATVEKAPEPAPAEVAEAIVETPEPASAASEAVEPVTADPEVEDSLEANSAGGNFTIPRMAKAPPPPPLLTPPLLDSGNKSAPSAPAPDSAPASTGTAAEVPQALATPEDSAALTETGDTATTGTAADAPARPAEQQAALASESALGEEPAEPSAGAEAPASAGIPSEQGGKPTLLARVTEDFDETYENFLGGWFFRWMGQKMGISKPENEVEEHAQRSPKAGAAVAISDLAPRPNQVRESRPAADVAPPLAVPAPEPVPEVPAASAPETEVLPTEFVANTEVPAESPADTGSDVLADAATDQIAALPAMPAEASPPEPTERAASDFDAPPGLTDGLQIVATAPTEPPKQISSRSDFEVPPGLTDGLQIVTSAPAPAAPAPKPEPAVARGGLDLPKEPQAPAPEPAPSAPPVGDVDSLPDVTPDAAPAAEPPALPVADVLGGGLPELTADAQAVPAPRSQEDQLAELGGLGFEDEKLNPVRAASDDAFGPSAVPPGSAHPVIGETAPEPPKPEPAVKDLDQGESLAALPEPTGSNDLGELDALASDLGAEAPAATGKGKVNDSLMSKLSQFLEADDPLTKNVKGSKAAKSDGLTELAALAKNVGVVDTAKVTTPVAHTLPETVLTLGESVHLTSAMPPKPDDPAEFNYCVEKQRNNVVFCVEPVDWPPDLAEKLRVSTIMYQGSQAVVRYDEGQASRFHAIFPITGFEPLVAYYARRFGPPSEIESRKIAPFGRPRQENPVYIWKRDDPLSGKKTTLEVRQFDDGRGGFPDLRHGAVMLYNDASKPIFPVLSALDLMPTTGTN